MIKVHVSGFKVSGQGRNKTSDVVAKSFQQKCAELGLDHKKTSLKDLACAKYGLDPKNTTLNLVEKVAGKPLKEIIAGM